MAAHRSCETLLSQQRKLVTGLNARKYFILESSTSSTNLGPGGLQRCMSTRSIWAQCLTYLTNTLSSENTWRHSCEAGQSMLRLPGSTRSLESEISTKPQRRYLILGCSASKTCGA